MKRLSQQEKNTRPVRRQLPQVLDCGVRAAARGANLFAFQVLDRGAEPVPAAPLAVRRTYLIVVLKPVLKALSAAT
jgi:hypothetical protein